MMSVIVVGNDVSEWVGTCLASVAASETGDYEVVYVDDGSTDGSIEVVEQLRPRLPALTVLRHESMRGPAHARNTGLAASRGDFLTFLDADDWVSSRYLAQMADVLADTDADFLRTDHVQVRGTRRAVHRAPEWRRGVVIDPRSGIGPPDTFSLIDYPYNSIGAFNRRLLDRGLLPFSWPDLHTAEDRPWLWRLHLQAETCVVASILGHFYRRGREKSLTTVGDARQLMYLDAYEIIFEMTRKDAEAERVHVKAMAQFMRLVARHLSLDERLAPPLGEEHTRRLLEMFARHRLLEDDQVKGALGSDFAIVAALQSAGAGAP